MDEPDWVSVGAGCTGEAFSCVVLLFSITLSGGKFEMRGLSSQLNSILSSFFMETTFSGAVISFGREDVLGAKRSSTLNWELLLTLKKIK